MKIIEIKGDPIIQLERFDDFYKYIFYLNDEALSEVKSYSKETTENIPVFFQDVQFDFMLFVPEGFDEAGNHFSETYIGIKYIDNQEYTSKIAGIYASDLRYKSPSAGKEVFLKKINLKVKKLS